MKKLLFILVCGLLNFSAGAQTEMVDLSQSERKVVFVDQFTQTSKFRHGDAETVRDRVLNRINACGRALIVDMATWPSILKEAERRKSEYMMQDYFGDMALRASHFIVNGHLENISSQRNVDTKGKVTYTVTILWTLKLTDPLWGIQVNNWDFRTSGTGDNEETAKMQALANTGNKTVMRFFKNNFKVQGNVLGIDKEEKGKAKSLVIDVGEKKGIREDDKFEVFYKYDCYGEAALEKIGEIEVEKVVSGSRAFCKVKDGEKEILEQKNAGKELVVITKYEK